MATYRRVCLAFLLCCIYLFSTAATEDNNFKNADTKLNKLDDNLVARGQNPKLLNVPAKHHSVKLASVAECQDDVRKLCSAGSTTNNFAVLDCLQSDKDVSSISKGCQHFIWMYKQNLTKDSRFDSAAEDVCKSALKQFPACDSLPKGEGQVISCLYEYKENVTDVNCKQFLDKMGSIIFSDYRLIFKFNEKCRADIENTQCGRIRGPEDDTHSQGPTIECLSDKVKDLSDDCKHEILRVAELQADDYHLDRALFYSCREDREKFCKRVKAGNGKVYKCLYKHKFEKEMSTECRDELTRRQKLMQEDYKVNKGLASMCRKDIREYSCMKGDKRPDSSVTDLKEGRLSHILLCLEDVMKKGNRVTPECMSEMKDMRRSMLEDYKISPDIVRFCSVHIQQECDGLERNGKTLHCLMDLARNKKKVLDSDCKNALGSLLVEADVSESWDVDPALQEACQPVVDTVCKDVKKGDGRVLGCLMEKVGSSKMTDDCEERLMELQYFMARDFRLDARLFKYCEKDAHKQCSAPDGWHERGTNVPNYPLIFNCLYQHLKQWSQDPNRQLSHACQFEVKRVMRQRALSVDLEPRIENACITDLGAFCSEDTDRGEEIACLQENFEDLADKCKWAVGNFTEDEDEDPNLDAILMKSCSPMIKEFCQEELKEQHVGPGDVMECLIENKNKDKMDPKCAAGIEHHQLINLKDYRFSFKFKEACKSDVMNLCKGIKKKSDVVTCLSEYVRNNTLLEQKHQVGQHCRKQLRFELLQRGEDIKLDPELQSSCGYDIDNRCSHKKGGNAEVIECLKNHADKLDEGCKKMIFKRERLNAILPNMDFSLVTKCAPMIKHYCKDVKPGELFKCLKDNKDDDNFDPRCKEFVLIRMRQKSTDYQLNPQLAKTCLKDIDAFCKHDIVNLTPGKHFEGKVLQCLRIKFAQKRLSPKCEDHIGSMIKESGLDYKQDHMLAKQCQQQIKDYCSQEMVSDNSDDRGRVEECLKQKLTEGKITSMDCLKEIARVLAENKADVHVDPILYKECAVDIKQFCSEIPRGEGRQMSCLLASLENKHVRLSPTCKKMLNDRKTMWEYAAKMAPPDTIGEVVNLMLTSESKNYFGGILFAIVGCLFLCGLMCGRVTKRHIAHKNK